MYVRYALFRVVTQYVVVNTRGQPYPETSVRIYHYVLRNNPEERRSHLHRGGSLKTNIYSDTSASE